MRRASALAKAFKGRWGIAEMDVWDNDDLDLAEPAHITFEGDNDGSFAFVAVTGEIDVRYGSRDGSACAEFTWEGFDDAEPARGAAGSPSEPPAGSSGISSSIRATTQASSPYTTDFFNGLLGRRRTGLDNLTELGAKLRAVFVSMRPYGVLGRDVEKFVLGIGGNRNGAVHVAGVFATIDVLPAHGILPKVVPFRTITRSDIAIHRHRTAAAPARICTIDNSLPRPARGQPGPLDPTQAVEAGSAASAQRSTAAMSGEVMSLLEAPRREAAIARSYLLASPAGRRRRACVTRRPIGHRPGCRRRRGVLVLRPAKPAAWLRD